MKYLVKLLSIVLCAALVIISVSYAKTAPPANLDEVFELFAEFEESFEDENYAEANEIFEELSKSIVEITDSVEDPNKADFALILKGLEEGLKQKNEMKIEPRYFRLQKAFFNILDNFEFETHPIISIIEKYIVEDSMNALKEKDYSDIVSEMKEVGSFINTAQDYLTEHGVVKDEIMSFRNQIVETVTAARNEDEKKTEESLLTLKKQIESFKAKTSS